MSFLSKEFKLGFVKDFSLKYHDLPLKGIPSKSIPSISSNMRLTVAEAWRSNSYRHNSHELIKIQTYGKKQLKDRASDISRKKKQNFQGQIRRKIGRFRGIFAGKKSKFAGKLADFAGFQRKKVKFGRIFRGEFLEKSVDFTRNFAGKLRQETISKKQPISLDFFLKSSLKSINFALIWPALFNIFLTEIIICSFSNSSLEKWANAKDINIMASAQFFATFM